MAKANARPPGFGQISSEQFVLSSGLMRRSASAPLQPLPASWALPPPPQPPKPPRHTNRPPAPIPIDHSLFTRSWAPEGKRYLHEHRQRYWLDRRNKPEYIDFSDGERQSFRRCFDSLAGEQSPTTVISQQPDQRLARARLEEMLISLGLTDNRKDVGSIIETLHGAVDKSGAIDFEGYLEMVRSRTDAKFFKMFQSMLEGSLGDNNLNLQTVISEHRRHLIMDATGSTKAAGGEKQVHGKRILSNFATLQHARHKEAAAAQEPTEALEFDNANGHVPTGGLEMIWNSIIHEIGLVSSRPPSASADKGELRHTPPVRQKPKLEKPMSPQEVIDSIVKARDPCEIEEREIGRVPGFGRTIVIFEPGLEQARKRLGTADASPKSRSTGAGSPHSNADRRGD